MKSQVFICILVVSTFFMTGCSNTTSVLDGSKGAAIKAKAEREMAEANKLVPSVNPLSNLVRTEKYYIPILEENEKNRPSWFIEEGEYEFKSFTLSEFMVLLQKKYGVNHRYLDGLDIHRAFSLYHKGPIGYALDKIKLATGFSYSIDGDVVTWSQYETAYIDISFIPGITNFRIGNKSNSSGDGDRNSSNSSIDTVVTDAGVENDTNFLNIEGSKMNSMSDITRTVHLLKSEKGDFNINESSSTLYIRDYPQNVKRIREAIKSENRKATAQVFLDIKILDYQNEIGDEYSLNWDVVSESLSAAGVVSLTNNFGGTLLDGTAAVLGYSRSSGKYAGSSALIAALDKQGVVYNVIEPKVTLRNNRIGKVISGSDTTYLASSGSSSTTTSSTDILIPGIVATGLNLYAIANINLDDMSVVGAIANKYASLTNMGTVSSDNALIQTPETSRKEFHQEFYVRDGETIMLSGLTSHRSEYSSSVMGSFLFGGSKGATEKYTNTIILLTPRIITR